MKIKLIEDSENFTNKDPQVFLLSADGTYILELSLEEIKDIIIAEGYKSPIKIAAPQHILLRGLNESMKKNRK